MRIESEWVVVDTPRGVMLRRRTGARRVLFDVPIGGRHELGEVLAAFAAYTGVHADIIDGARNCPAAGRRRSAAAPDSPKNQESPAARGSAGRGVVTTA